MKPGCPPQIPGIAKKRPAHFTALYGSDCEFFCAAEYSQVMRLVRCRACRTVCDGDRYLTCLGCSASLANAPPTPRGSSVTVHHAERDALISRRTLWILAGIFLASILVAGFPLAIIPAFGAFFLLTYLAWSQIFRGLLRSRLPSIAQVLLCLLGLFLALVGSFFLVMLACSVPLSHFE